MKYPVLSFLILLMIGSCDNESPAPTVTLPSNLQVEVNIAADGSGKVDVTATAVNASFYTVSFGVAGVIPVKSTDGTATYTYAESGDYTIVVRAHATANDFISDETDVTITKSDGVIIPAEGYTTPLTYPNMTMVWQDEFSGEELNTADWTFETGGHGWGNNEKQYYRNENVSLQDGHLIITAKKESYSGKSYTSSRIITKGKKEFKYGRIDIRALLPEGQGIWPALWMLGSSFPNVTWPASGEIDIMEMIGGSGRENTVYGTVHWDNAGQYASYGKSHTLSSGTFNDKFHVFTIIWDSEKIVWYMDDVEFNVIDTTPAGLSEFQNSFFLIFNVAVGGNWPGDPNPSTVFPQHMIVDYVRVFQAN
jgi:beta-glucanase (GH16 family)